MKIEIRYLSKSGNTKKLADAIGEELEVKALDISNNIKEKTAILFLGGAYYGFDIDKELKAFIESLDDKVKKVAIFSTSAFMKGVPKRIKKHLKRKNIEVIDETFYCKGEYRNTNIGKPDDNDLTNIKAFASMIISNLS